MKNKLVYGHGINDLKHIKGIGKTKAYKIWNAMLRRAYSPKWHERFPTYIGCSVCDEWLTFSNFKNWFDDNYIEDYQIDKDLLNHDNKQYSPEFCIFVPR